MSFFILSSSALAACRLASARSAVDPPPLRAELSAAPSAAPAEAAELSDWLRRRLALGPAVLPLTVGESAGLADVRDLGGEMVMSTEGRLVRSADDCEAEGSGLVE